MIPWRDRNGGFSWFKLAVFIGVLAPALWLGGLALAGGLGPRPWVAATHFTGDWGLRLLCLCLAVTPVRQVFHWPAVMSVRRMLGLAAMAYALAHLGLYIADQAFDLVKIASEIALRLYLTIGFAAVVGLVALGVTSTDAMIKRLGGRRWRALHRLVYPLAILAVVHFLMQSKLDVTEAVIMAGVLVWLLGLRLLPVVNRWSLTGLAVASTAATAGIEAVWIGLKAGAPMLMILAANLDPALGPRPAWWIAAGGLAVVAATWGGDRLQTGRKQRRRTGNLSSSPHILASG